ncbi:MAG: CBS domain-containing protein [Chloroflexi bacterium]|nr:CBS domain-containing protein [Chloroflexota bacterium]
MDANPRDESRAATVREGGPESWTEAGELIDTPTNMPTAAGARTSGGSVPPAAGEATSPFSSQGPAAAQRRRAGSSASRVESSHPSGSDFSSSAAPAGQGSNTPVGAESSGYRAWDDRQEEPGTFGRGESNGMMPIMSSLGGLAMTAAAGGLGYLWWKRRQKQQSRGERLKAALLAAGTSLGASAGSDFPRMLGQAAAQSKSAWLPLAVLPIAMMLREYGKAGERASDQLLQPLELDKRSKLLAKQGSDLIDAKLHEYRKRLVQEVDPSYNSGWGWTPWLLGGAMAGGAYVAYRQGWLDSMMGGSAGTMSGGSEPAVRDVMTRSVATVDPEATIAEVARKMRDLDVGSLPVCDGSKLIGIVTDRDLSVRATAAAKDPNTTHVREVMSPQLTWVFEDEPADAAARVMRERQIRRLPVLDRGDRLVGVVALADLATDLGDDRLKGATLEEISQPSGANPR